MKRTKKLNLRPTFDIHSIDILSTNTNLIVVGGRGGLLYLYDTKTSNTVWINKDFVDCTIVSVDVSPNDDIVAGGGHRCLIMIHAANGDSICSVDVGEWIYCVLFLSQQKIACGLTNGTVAIVCWQTQKIDKILKVGERSVLALAISPLNNDILLTGDGAGVIKQTIISSEKTVMVYEGQTDAVNDLSFLSCGNMFVSGSGDQTARLFALDQKQAIRVFKGHTHGVLSVSLIHDDELLITTSYDDTVKVWKIESGECMSTMKAEQQVWCGAVSKDDQSLVVGGYDGKMTLFSLPLRPRFSLDRSLKISNLIDVFYVIK